MTSVHDFRATSLGGEGIDLRDYAGKLLLIVNVASRCGYTPQYAGLESLYRKYRDRGFAVLGFPCNQFGAQEPGTSQEIAEFCRRDYGVSFPLMGKIEVKDAQRSREQQLETFVVRNTGFLEFLALGYVEVQSHHAIEFA